MATPSRTAPQAIVRGGGRPDAYRKIDGTRVASVTTITGWRASNPEPLRIWHFKQGYEIGYADHETGRHRDPDKRRIPRDAATAGTLAHLMVENTIHGLVPMTGINLETTDEKTIQAAQTGFKGYQQWQAVTGVQYRVTEEPMVSELHGYGGTPDAIGKTLDGLLCLIDWKSSNAVYGDYIIQLAAYAELWRELHPTEPIQAVYLLRFGKEAGDFHFHSYPPAVIADGWEAFQCLLRLYELDKKLKRVAT